MSEVGRAQSWSRGSTTRCWVEKEGGKMDEWTEVMGVKTTVRMVEKAGKGRENLLDVECLF